MEVFEGGRKERPNVDVVRMPCRTDFTFYPQKDSQGSKYWKVTGQVEKEAVEDTLARSVIGLLFHS